MPRPGSGASADTCQVPTQLVLTMTPAACMCHTYLRCLCKSTHLTQCGWCREACREWRQGSEKCMQMGSLSPGFQWTESKDQRHGRRGRDSRSALAGSCAQVLDTINVIGCGWVCTPHICHISMHTRSRIQGPRTREHAQQLSSSVLPAGMPCRLVCGCAMSMKRGGYLRAHG